MARDITWRDSREVAPGVWRDPISEARHDYDGSQAGFEAALTQTKSMMDAVTGGRSDASLDMIWDAALEVAATIAEHDDGQPHICERIARNIRLQKKQR